MSTLSFRPSASVGVWSLAIVLLILLAKASRLIATTAEPPIVNEPVIVGANPASRVEAKDRDPSVPDASNVSFPVGDATEPAIAMF